MTMNFIRKLKEAIFLCQVLVNFYRIVIESILSGHILNWHWMCIAQDRRALQQVLACSAGVFATRLADSLLRLLNST